MKAYILYHPRSDHSRIVEEYAHDFERIKGKKVELLSLETQEGAAMANLYGIVEYPAVIALRQDGQLLKNWEGLPLPLMNELAAYND
jgi:thioredoxin-like negative regulator of GroEL